MEIANNLVTTLSQADSPNQLSEGNPPAKNAKKKGQAESSSFDASMDGALAALVAGASQAETAAQQKGIEKPLAGQSAELAARMGEQAAAKVELSTKNVSGKTESGAPAPTVASLFQAKAQQSANGTMTDALIAGPNTPWNSRWVFGGKQPTSEDMNAAQASGGRLEGAPSLETLKALVEQAKSSAEGGDTVQLKQAGEAASQDLDALNALVSQYGGEIADMRVDGSEKPAKPAMGLVSGGDYLSVMNAGKSPAKDGAGAQSGFGSEGGFESREQAGAQASARAKNASASRPDLRAIPGGISAGTPSGRLEGGLKASKEELRPTAYETVFLGAAPAAALRGNESMGPVPPQMVTGHVVPGAMMRERLTSESLRKVATGIQGMSASGGGEMRIRMNPENLGELMIRVSTNGKDVGLKVHASDASAKKILEESLGSLRDSLAQQSLALGRVDVVVGTTASQDANSASQQQSHQQSSNQQHAQMGMGMDSGASQTGGQWGNEESSGASERGVPTARGTTSRLASASAAMGRASSSRTADSRLDVMA